MRVSVVVLSATVIVATLACPSWASLVKKEREHHDDGGDDSQQQQQRLLGNTNRLEDRTTSPRMDSNQVQTVVETDLPPGNIAVSSSGRIFFTYFPYFPAAQDQVPRSTNKVVELIYGRGNNNGGDGPIVPFPSQNFQTEFFNSPLSIRIDRMDRLWVLDDPYLIPWKRPQLTAFDIDTGEILHRHEFSVQEACYGSF